MNGVHDLGGMHGFGSIDPEPEDAEALFDAGWERQVFGLVLATGALGQWSIDASRHSRERLDPVEYLSSSYYRKWLGGLESLLVDSGLVTAQELSTGAAEGRAPAALTDRVLHPENVATAMAKGGPADMPTTQPSRFGIGDLVRVRHVNIMGHTRAVRYARGHVGTVELHHGCHVFPDASAQGERVGEHLYTVAFDAEELWGDVGVAGDSVRVDLWEPYLDSADVRPSDTTSSGVSGNGR